jgi:phosphoribosylglycinamide formyltransferase-1
MPQRDERPRRGRPIRLGVLASGNGSNLQAILDAISEGRLEAEVVLVACNHGSAKVIERAARAGVTVQLHSMKDYPSRSATQQAIAESFEGAGVELVVCVGWDRVLVPEFTRRFAGRMINIHPSLLPAFAGGLHAIRDALDYGVKVTGCTVHFVTEAVDAGPIIVQTPVSVYDDDTEETLAERVHKEEHRILVEAIKLYAESRLKVEGRKVSVPFGETASSE